MVEDRVTHQAHETMLGGIKGVAIGAAVGGIAAVLLSWILDELMRSGSGGFALHFIAGASFGGLVGFFLGAIRRSRLAG
jgi:hypothetical protein